MSAPGYRVRELQAGDEARVHELHRAVFAQSLTPEHWRWRFARNPFGAPMVQVAETNDGQRLVGHCAFVPVPLVEAGGRRRLGGLAIQSMVHPAHQRQGILKALLLAAEAQQQARGVSVGLTFLNDNSLHAYTQRFGWTPLAGPNPIFVHVFDWKRVLHATWPFGVGASTAASLAARVAPMLLGRPGVPRSTLRFREVDHFDARIDRLWSKVSRDVGIGVDRTSAYLSWRIVESPDRYRIVVAEDAEGMLQGLVVTRRDRKFAIDFGYVVELLFDPADARTGRALVEHALAALRAEGCAMATALTAGSRSVLRALRAGGFRRLPRVAMPHGIHFCSRRRGSAAADWFVSWLDHDVV